MWAAILRVLVYLVTGYIFFLYSERMFWARWRPAEDGAESFIITWITYSIAAACCVVLIRDYRVHATGPMFLVGAVLGWLVEGVFTMTFFGADGIPFPFTIAWTGLSWHALISVVIGWLWLHRAMQHSVARTAKLSAGLGAAWGVWSIYWDTVSPPGTALDFLAHTLGTTLLMIVAFRLYPLLRTGRLRPGMSDRLVLGALALGWFGAVTVPTFTWLALVTLPPLFALVWLALRINARVETAPDFLDELARPVPWSRSLTLLLIPVLATLIHEGCRATGLSAPTNLLGFFITLPLGFWCFYASLRGQFRLRRAAASAIRQS